MAKFEPGDIVVCINNGPTEYGNRMPADWLTVGAEYTVKDMANSDQVELVGLSSKIPWACRFELRKKAPDEYDMILEQQAVYEVINGDK